MTDTLLEVQDLTVDFHTHGSTVEAVRGVSFSVARGETLAIVEVGVRKVRIPCRRFWSSHSHAPGGDSAR